MLEHHKELRDKLELELVGLKRAKIVDEDAIKRVQLSIESLNERIKLQERKLRRYE